MNSCRDAKVNQTLLEVPAYGLGVSWQSFSLKNIEHGLADDARNGVAPERIEVTLPPLSEKSVGQLSGGNHCSERVTVSQ